MVKGKIEQFPLLKLFSFFQAYSLLQRIVKAGGHRGLQECERQFKNEVWNCSINGKHVVRELPIFVKTTLPQGKTTSHRRRLQVCTPCAIRKEPLLLQSIAIISTTYCTVRQTMT